MRRDARKTPAKRRVEPFAQGDLDGMCAIYTIINAMRALCPELTMSASTALFQRLIRSLHTHTNDALSPVLIGTSRSLLRKLLAEAKSHVGKQFKVNLEIRPKGRSIKAKSLDVAWDRLAAILDERTVVIFELGGRCSHWTVVYDVKPKTMLLLDSGDRRNLKRSHCTLRPSKTRYQLKLPATIAISRVVGPA
jgi:hypothetical protein